MRHQNCHHKSLSFYCPILHRAAMSSIIILLAFKRSQCRLYAWPDIQETRLLQFNYRMLLNGYGKWHTVGRVHMCASVSGHEDLAVLQDVLESQFFSIIITLLSTSQNGNLYILHFGGCIKTQYLSHVVTHVYSKIKHVNM